MGHAGTDTDVLIAGAGPTGLMLACELRLAGADVTVVDRLAERTGESRAGGLHARTLEVLDQRGVLDRFLAAGEIQSVGHFSGLWLDFDESESRHSRPLMILQSTIERLLEEWAAELGVRVRWSSEVTGIRQDGLGVSVELRTAEPTPRTLRARYAVGCDGGRSSVRKLAGFDFPGTEATMTALLGDVELPDLPEEYIFMRRCPGGHYSVIALEPGWYRVITTEYGPVADREEPATFEQLREALIRLAGTDWGMHSPRWVSRFGDAARQASRYRDGRVLLAGDAAHIHYPAGGQGLNVGVQDAVNLGWKLASVVRGQAPVSLLDSYHAERHPVAERVLHNTRAQSALARPGAQTDALRDVLASLMVFDDVNRYLCGMITGLDIRYPVDDEHPLAGHRVPDADLKTPDGAARVYELLHGARPVLLDLRGSSEVAAAAEGWADHVDVVEARSDDDLWPVPGADEIPAPAALLIRPDGHVAWATAVGGAPRTAALRTALATWFGPARRA
ncbi:FAD-dependent monooxygenase [Streptomyces violaceus]|uniref:FAD-dependent monooxygenase n=1 Tax=Streptomyces violaceus TaxID=1936 RepID=A0ABY9U1R1_STRVL|nr:FAD-dependent monooxygenase [Streptomyces janthinus]WND16713.1 FAD-dependent monooxygenase [Streptomyces janthinus]GGS43503.1 putative monooxygenase [Streptomyces janthinus]